MLSGLAWAINVDDVFRVSDQFPNCARVRLRRDSMTAKGSKPLTWGWPVAHMDEQ